MNVHRTEKAMALVLAAIVLSFATIVPGLTHNSADAAADTQERLQQAHAMLTDKMARKDTQDIPVFLSYVDEKTSTLVVGIDDKAPEPLSVYDERLRALVGNIPMNVGTGHFTPTSCSSRTSDCDPLIGGIQVKNTVSGSTYTSTLTLGDTNTSGKKGFIMTGHAPGWGTTNVDVGQATTSRIVGKIITNPSGPTRSSDAAFVEFKKDLFGNYIYTANENQIYRTSSTTYSVIGKKTSSQTSLDDPIRLHGISTGYFSGYIIGKGLTLGHPNGTLTGQVATNAIPASGDSGGPVTTPPVGTNYELYFLGIIVGYYELCNPTCSSVGIYSPWESIKSELSLTN